VGVVKAWVFDMKINYTSRLFFKKYAYKVVLACQTSGNRWFWRQQDQLPQEFQSVQHWCSHHVPHTHKIQRRYVGGSALHSDWHQMVYLQHESDKDQLLKAHAADVLQVWQPLNDQHLKQLDVKNVQEVRAQLIYKRFAHVIYFKYDRTCEMWDWLQALLADSTESELRGDKWWPRVYSASLDDVQQILFCYSDRVHYVKHVIVAPK
jgi:hypothetical protein